MTTDSYGNYTQSGRKGYSSRTIKVNQLVETTWLRLLVSINGASNKTAFDTDDWTLTTTVTAQSVTCVGPPASDAVWTTIATPSGISYFWEGTEFSTSSTATVKVSSVPMGPDGDTPGTKNVTVEVIKSLYTSGKATVTLGRYGKSYYNG